MFENFSPEAKKVLMLSRSAARALGHSTVAVEHILLALFETMEEDLKSEFAKIGITSGMIKSAIKAKRPSDQSYFNIENVTLGADAYIIFAKSQMEAKRLDDPEVETKHIFLAFEWFGLSERGNCLAWEILMNAADEFKVRKLVGKKEYSTEYKPWGSDRRSPKKTAKPLEPIEKKPPKEAHDFSAITLSEYGRDTLEKYFSASAIKVLFQGQEEAKRLGHNFLGTEQILLGLFADENIASKALTTLGLNLEDLRVETEKIIGRGTGHFQTSVPFTPRSKRIVSLAYNEAKKLSKEKIEPEHLLLAIESEGDGVAYKILQNYDVHKKISPTVHFMGSGVLNVSDDQLDAIFNKMLAKPDTSTIQEVDVDKLYASVSLSDDSMEEWNNIIVLAKEEAVKTDHNQVGTQFLLIALSIDRDTVAGAVLNNLGLNTTKLRTEIIKKIGRGTVYKAPLTLTPGTLQVLEFAKDIAIQTGCQTIETEHILLGLMNVGSRFHGCIAWEIILEAGLQDKIRSAISEELMDEKSRTRLNRRKAQNEFKQKAKRRKEQKHLDEPIAASISPAPAPTAEQGQKSVRDYFSEKTLKVLFLAKGEARLLNHNFLGTEQIFLGIMAEKSSIAAKSLASLGLNLDDLRVEVQKIIGKGKGSVVENPPFTPRTKRILELAHDEARQLGHRQIEPEHILLAIVREGDGVAYRVLENFSVHESIRKRVLQQLEMQLDETSFARRDQAEIVEKRPLEVPENFSSISIRVIENAHTEAKSLAYPFIEPEHLLLGIAKETSNETGILFQSRGVGIKQFRNELKKLKPRGPGGSETLRLSDSVKEIFEQASNDAIDLVEPQDLLGYLILSLDLTTINLLRNLGLEDMLDGATEFVSPSSLFQFMYKSKLADSFLPNSFKIILRAQDLARQSGHDFAGSEHILLAVLELDDDPCVCVLKKHGISLDATRKQIRKLIGVGTTYITVEIPLAPSAIDALRNARDEAEKYGQKVVQPGHLILGLMLSDRGAAGEVLKKCADIRDEIVIAMSEAEK